MRIRVPRWAGGMLASLCLASEAALGAAYDVSVDLNGLAGANAVLAVDFIDGGSPGDNGVALSAIATGGTPASIATVGTVTGGGPWILYDASTFNEVKVNFSPSGSALSFSFTTTDNFAGGAAFPDGLSVFLLNSAGASLVTTSDPTGANALVLYSLGAGGAGLAVYQPQQAGVVVSVTVNPSPADVAFPLTIATAGAGAVTSRPSGIACGSQCAASYAMGTPVTVAATPAPGWVFTGWSGSCKGTVACNVFMFPPKDALATFTFAGAGSARANEWVQKAFVAYYGRPADPAGLGYWANRMDQEGGSLSSIVAEFGTSAEFNRRYGGLSYSQLLDALYQQTLGRAPDAAGKQYYLDQLDTGKTTLQTITLDLLGGVTGIDVPTAANRLDTANHFTGKVAAGCPYGGESTGVNALAAVTADLATVWAAKAVLDDRCAP